ncbi:amidohydrolase [Halothermothrix orenii]|uniref:Amidohydrolase n=1 Tax=Halothermothrix orenii (strain H 168 / OCM 544 / DSM 9562) TaxID=373903 RepID=B8D0W9_HALOH|nr:amidohydrolase [Halothermothrix orenii]ACL68938.1 amidohydrolase [Halothermothrix orenii H 168]
MLALVKGKVLTMAGKRYEEGLVIIDKGKIREVGPYRKPPADVEVIDVSGKVVMPGLIDAHTHLGIGEDGLGWEGRDYNEMTDPITPHLRAIDAINPEDDGFATARKNGVTTVMTGPGSANVLGGESVAVKTMGKTVDEMIIKNPVGIKAAFGENPKRVYHNQKKSPSTRMAVAALMREAFMEAQDYLKSKEEKISKNKAFKRNLKMESLARVIKGEIPLKAHAHRADDIMTILRIAREFNIKVTLEHCTEGHKIAEEIVRSGVPAIVGPTLTGKTKVELKNRTFETPGILSKAGVKVALMSDHPVIPVENLTVYAALAVKSGMNREEALKAITINPAEILGIDDRVGSLEPGKDADLVVFDRDPLDIMSKVEMVFINGDRVMDLK